MVSNEHETSLTVFIFEVKFWKLSLYAETTPYSLNVNNPRQVMTFFHLENNIWIKFNMSIESMIAVSSSNSVILREKCPSSHYTYFFDWVFVWLYCWNAAMNSEYLKTFRSLAIVKFSVKSFILFNGEGCMKLAHRIFLRQVILSSKKLCRF